MGILWRGSPQDEEFIEYDRAILESLRDKGWMEDKSLIVVRVYSREKDERLPVLAEQLVRSRVDLIVAGGHITTLAAARVTTKIPIVFSQSMPCAVEQGLVESFARPGRNVTGKPVSGGDVEAAGPLPSYDSLSEMKPSRNSDDESA